MKRLLLFFLAIAAMTACNNEAGYTRAEDAQEAGREFIRASLDGNISRANFYLLKDSANLMVFDKWKSNYQHLTTEEKVAYKEANILPSKIENIDDSTVSYTYSNSFKKESTTLTIVKVNGEWLVDLKDIH